MNRKSIVFFKSKYLCIPEGRPLIRPFEVDIPLHDAESEGSNPRKGHILPLGHACSQYNDHICITIGQSIASTKHFISWQLDSSIQQPQIVR